MFFKKDLLKELCIEANLLEIDIEKLKTLKNVTDYHDLQQGAIDTGNEAKQLLIEAIDKYLIKYYDSKLSRKKIKYLESLNLPRGVKGFSLTYEKGRWDNPLILDRLPSIGDIYYEKSSLTKFKKMIDSNIFNEKSKNFFFKKFKEKVLLELENDTGLLELSNNLLARNGLDDDFDTNLKILNFKSFYEAYPVVEGTNFLADLKIKLDFLELRGFKIMIKHSSNVPFIFIKGYC